MTYVTYKKNELRHLKVSDMNMSVPNLQNNNKTETIANLIMKSIDTALKTNVAKIGDLLPKKSDLAYYLGVSLGTIQNVLKILEDREYIYSKQKIGSIIKDKNDNASELRKRTSKKDIAEELIKNYILTNKMEVGSHMPATRQLAREINMTVNTVMSAISKLITDGIVKYDEKKNLVILNNEFIINENTDEETLVSKVTNDLKQHICSNYSIGDRLPANEELAKEFNVSMKTMHNAIQALVKEKMLLTRRGSYGTTVISNSQNPAVEPRREMSIFAPAQETAFYHYEKIQNKIKNIIINNYDIGSKLPSINELSELLDVNKNTIRKALNNLAKQGILRFARGRYGGTYVIGMPESTEQAYRWLAINR